MECSGGGTRAAGPARLIQELPTAADDDDVDPVLVRSADPSARVTWAGSLSPCCSGSPSSSLLAGWLIAAAAW